MVILPERDKKISNNYGSILWTNLKSNCYFFLLKYKQRDVIQLL